jgi:hypothetical protein
MCINAVGDTTVAAVATAAAILLFLIAIDVAMCHMQITHTIRVHSIFISIHFIIPID